MTMTTSTYTPSNTVFLRALQGPVSQGEHLWVCSFAEDPSVEEPVSRWFGRPLAADAAVELSSRRNNYFSTAILKDGRRKRASFVRLMVLVADDADQTKLKAPPTWVLRTSRHKVQVGFAIRDDVDAFCWDTVGRALKAMHEKGLVGADKSGNNAARYARLPVGSNTKAAYGEPFAHELIEWRPEAVFSLAEALQALGVDPAVLAEPQRPAASVLDHLPSGITGELRDAVMRLDPDMGRDDWLHVGMALHHESGGDWDALSLWDQWSAKGSKYKSAEDLEIRWDSFGRYTGKPRTGASVLQMARALPLTAEDFEVEAPSMVDDSEEPATGAAPAKRGRFDPVPLDELMARPARRWLIKSLLPLGGVGIVYGPSKAGKSFFVIDLCMSVLRGEPWRGLKVVQGPVAYIVAEGAGGFPDRLRAYAKHHGVGLQGLPLHVIPAAPNLLKHPDVTEVADVLTAIEGLRVVVVDTLAQVTAGGDENSGKDMNTVMAHCQALAQITGALVLLVGHSGKDESRGVRGWSGMGASFDVALRLERDGDYRCAIVDKLKDGRDGGSFPFALEDVVLGADEDGEDITSCVVTEPNALPGKKAPTSKHQALVWSVLENLDAFGDPVTTEALIANVSAAMDPAVRKATRNQRAREAVAALIKDDLLVCERGEIRKSA